MCCNMTRGRRWSFHVVSSWRGSAEFQGSSSRSGSELEGLPGRSRYWRAGDNPLRWENSQSLRIGNLKNVRLLSKCSRVVLNTFWILSSLSSPYSSSPVIKDSRPSIYFYLFFFSSFINQVLNALPRDSRYWLHIHPRLIIIVVICNHDQRLRSFATW